MFNKLLIIAVLSTLLLTICPRQVKREPSEKLNFPDRISADFPTDLAFTQNKLFFTEKGGALKMLDKGKDDPKTLTTINVPDLAGYNETGLLGIALSPNFNESSQIFLYHTYSKDSQLFNRVIRINTGEPQKKPVVILDGILGGTIHDGGKLAFGPEGNLYIATGEANQPDLAQNKNSLNGKVLRIKPDGSIPEDNPFGNAVWSFGHRNIFGMTFDNKGNLFVTENGPTENDEVNRIIKGGNYGWPFETGPGSGHFIKPLITYKTQIAPTGIIFYTGKRYNNNDLTDKLVFGDYNNGDMHKLKLLDNTAEDKIIARNQGQINALAQTKDGFIYLATRTAIKKLTPP